MPQPQQCGIWASSATYTSAHSSARSLTYSAGPGTKPESSWILVGFVTTEPWWELTLSKRGISWLLKVKNISRAVLMIAFDYTTQIVSRTPFLSHLSFLDSSSLSALWSASWLQLFKPHTLTAFCLFSSWSCKTCELHSDWTYLCHTPTSEPWLWRREMLCTGVDLGLGCWLFPWFPLHSLLLYLALYQFHRALHLLFPTGKAYISPFCLMMSASSFSSQFKLTFLTSPNSLLCIYTFMAGYKSLCWYFLSEISYFISFDKFLFPFPD